LDSTGDNNFRDGFVGQFQPSRIAWLRSCRFSGAYVAGDAVGHCADTEIKDLATNRKFTKFNYRKEEFMKALMIYAVTWFLLLAAAGGVYITGYFNETMITVFGFIFATLLAAGILMVLPFWVDEHYSWKY
jgi:hypothetical protein